ncbi:MAG: HAD-IB family phosphatase [Christensenellaceae bacterium]|jgi:phosphatidylglycerophosphatase C
MNVYDFDGTIYDGDSTADFYFHMLKKKPSLLKYLPRQLWAFFSYAIKRIKKTEMKERFYVFLQGINDMEHEVNIFWDKHTSKIKSWYPAQQKEDDVIISASPEFLLGDICARLNIKYLMASRVDARTGKYEGVNCHGQEKVRRFYERFPEGKIAQFYSDGVSDRPLAELAAEAFFVKKDRITKWDFEKQ